MTRECPRPNPIGRLVLALALCASIVFIAAPAYADSATEGAAAREAFDSGEHLYVAPEAGQQVDAGALADAVGDDPIYVAVVPPNTPPEDVLVVLREGVAEPATYVVVSGTEQAAESSVICSTQAQPLLDDASSAQAESRSSGDLTGFLVAYVDSLADAPEPGDDGCSDEVDDSGSFASAVPWILGALVIGVGGGLLWLTNRRRHRAAQRTRRGKEVTAALDALARDIDEVPEHGDAQISRALQDARNRHIAAADILTDAEASADFDEALRACREGAVAVHFARERAGLTVGRLAEVEPVHARRVAHSEVMLLADGHVTVYRSYRPGAPYFFGGNDELPAGWYTSPVGHDRLFGDITGDE
ncbi:MAG: hypothetical protein ACK5MR_15665 [Cumulibacter sp.]